MSEEVLVLGGGVAGLAAAWILADRGVPVTLVEKRRSAGGKAFSFPVASGGEIDNGQHVFLGCCTRLSAWLVRLGTAHLAPVDRPARIPFLMPGGAVGWIGESPLPAPLQSVPSLLAYPHLTLSERLRLLRGLDRLRRASPAERAAWDAVSFAELLTRLGQTERMRRRFWDPVVVSALNVLPERASAALAALVFREALSGDRRGGRLAVPRTGLSDLIARPAQRAIREKGGRVLTGARVDSLEIASGAVRGARLSDGAFLPSGRIVSALAWDDLLSVLPPGPAGDPFFARAARLAPSPIVGIHLRFDAEVTDLPLAGLLESPLHWVFRKGDVLDLIVSDAREWLPLGTGEILRKATAELVRFFPRAAGARLLEGRVIKERRATFAPVPGVSAFRLPARTPVQGLFLAGAWTDTGWPATLEGAVRSGQAAAAALLGG